MNDLWVVASLFNPAGFSAPVKNYQTFAAKLVSQGVNLLTIELAFYNAPFSLPASPFTYQFRSRSPMWQKERMINHALRLLPSSCTKVAWVDADILFADAEWPRHASRKMDRTDVVQLFDRVTRLQPGMLVPGVWDFPETGTVSSVLRGGSFEATCMGFAWAARRDWLERVRLYDRGIVGSGDYILLNAVLGQETVFEHPPLDESIARWSKIVQETRPRVGFVEGHISHLYHGSMSGRRYHDRHLILRDHNFLPDLDIYPTGASWEWATHKPSLHRAVLDYFVGRQEDAFIDPS